MDAVGFKFSPLFGGVAKTCAEGSEDYVSEQKGDPMADKTNEGLNLAPRVAEGGERAILKNIISGLHEKIEAAKFAGKIETIPSHAFRLEGYALGLAEAADFVEDIIETL